MNNFDYNLDFTIIISSQKINPEYISDSQDMKDDLGDDPKNITREAVWDIAQDYIVDALNDAGYNVCDDYDEFEKEAETDHSVIYINHDLLTHNDDYYWKHNDYGKDYGIYVTFGEADSYERTQDNNVNMIKVPDLRIVVNGTVAGSPNARDQGDVIMNYYGKLRKLANVMADGMNLALKQEELLQDLCTNQFTGQYLG